MHKTKVKFNFFSFLFILALIITGNKITYCTLFAAAIHEVGHLLAAKILRIHLIELNIDFMGARLSLDENIHSYKDEIVLCAFGPLFNFIGASLSLLLLYIVDLKEIISIFVFSSLSLGILNLLPINTFDGGRILEAVLNQFLYPDQVKKIIDIVSFFVVFLLWCISVYFLLIYSSSISLFVFSLSLFFTLFLKDDQ